MTDTATLAGLDPATLTDTLRVAGSPGFDRWQDQIRRTGGCANPIHLTGWTLTKDRTTGETLHHYSTEHEPGARLRIACGNRRASRCPACARFVKRLRREIAARAGLTQHELAGTCRLSYGKVAEFQKRGAVHFHAVIRLDGPARGGESPD